MGLNLICLIDLRLSMTSTRSSCNPTQKSMSLKHEPAFEQLLHRNVQRFLVFKARRLLYHATLSLRMITKKRRNANVEKESDFRLSITSTA